MGDWNRLSNPTPDVITQLQASLQQVGFHTIHAQYSTATFLAETNRHLSSLKLESMATTLLDHRLATVAEIHALITELRAFEQANTTMISTPGIQRVSAVK